MKYLFSLLSIVIVLIVGALVAPSFVDWSQYKTELQDQLQKATGYNLDVQGDIQAAFLPAPHIRLNTIKIDSGTATGPVSFAGEAETVSVSVALLPLLSGKIEVEDVTLARAVVAVQEQNSKTENQKRLEQITAQNDSASQVVEGADSATGSASSLDIRFNKIRLDDVAITYQPLSGDAMAISFPAFNVAVDSLAGPFHFDGQVLFQDFDVVVDGHIGEMIDGQPMTTTMAINDQAYAVTYSGIFDLNKDIPEAQGEFAIKADSLAVLAAQFGAADLPIKDQSLALSGFVNGSAQAVQLNNGKMALGGAAQDMPVSFAFNPEQQTGRFKIQNLPQGGMVDMDLTMGEGIALDGQVMIDSLQAVLVDLLGVVEPSMFDAPQVPRRVSGDVKVTLGDEIRLSSQSLTLDQYRLKNTDVRYKAGDVATIDVKIADLNGAAITAAGIMDMQQGIKVTAAHPNALDFIRIVQPDFAGGDNLQNAMRFEGLIKTADALVQIDDMTARLGDIEARGDISLNMAASIPSVTANMMFQELDTRALITGETSSAANGGSGTSGSAKSASSSRVQSAQGNESPWSRDAIDTSGLRAINLDLTAKAQSLVHGTWVIKQPEIDLDLQNGVLTLNHIKGGLFDGDINLSGRVEAREEGQPLSLQSTMKAADVDLSQFVMAAMAQNKDRVTGTGTIDLTLNANGLSSSALIYSLNGDGTIQTSDLVVKGIDFAKVTEAIADESLTDLANVVQGAFRSGQTPFEPINHPITIREGAMAVDNFTLVSPTANIISDGAVNFAAWTMDVKNTVDFTDPDDLPNVEMTLKGPLNAPQQNVANDVLISFIRNKYGQKIQEKVNELVGDSPAGALINNILGLPPQAKEPQLETAEDAQASPEEAEEDTQSQQQQPPRLEEQLIRGLFDRLAQ